MRYDFRAIRPDEWGEALELWHTVFGDGEWLFDSLHRATENRKWEHCCVAVDETGRLVSAVDLFIRPVRGADGAPIQMAGVGSVATLEDARRQGLSGKLLEHAIQTMEREGCAWSHLFTGANEHYRRYGWFEAPLKTLSGMLRSDLGAPVEAEHLNDAGIDAWMGAFAGWWDADNAARPLSHVRTEQYWRIAIRPRMGQGDVLPNRKVLLVRDQGVACGYVVYGSSSRGAGVLEVAGDVELGLRAFAQAIGGGKATFSVPYASVVKGLVDEVETHMGVGSMARGVAGGLGAAEITAMFEAPGAHHWRLDDF